jgi:hypothetical protein
MLNEPIIFFSMCGSGPENALIGENYLWQCP